MRVFEKVVNKYLQDMVVLEVLSVKIGSIRNAKIKEENGKAVVNISDPETTMDDVVNMTDRCRKENNSCCGPQFFEKMTDFYVSGKDGDVDINMVGDGITKHKMEEKLGQCDCLEDGD